MTNSIWETYSMSTTK